MHDRIVIDPAIQHGKPVLRGTRVPVVCVLGGLAGGMTPAEICQEYESVRTTSVLYSHTQ
jgi:uncharacterized protein (DUF433 family)